MSEQIKPVLVVYLPDIIDHQMSAYEFSSAREVVKEQTGNQYHVIVCIDKIFRIECLNVQDSTELNIEELQKLLLDKLKL